MNELETFELFIDEAREEDGIEAISLVEFPAIEENFVALSKHKVEFKTVDTEKRVIVGLALVQTSQYTDVAEIKSIILYSLRKL